MKVRIISDLHLGHGASCLTDPEMLDSLLVGVDELVLAGDVWQSRALGKELENARELLDRLVRMVSERGVTLRLLRGNHDPEGGKGVLFLEGKQVLVTHGDAVYDDATPWAREIHRYREEVAEIVEKYGDLSDQAEACAERAREIAMTIKPVPMPRLPPPLNYFVTALWPPSRAIEMTRVWLTMGEEGLRFLERSGEGASVLVCGHFHRPGIWEKGGRVMVNTGAFMKGCRPWAVELEKGVMIARALDLVAGRYELGEVKGRWEISKSLSE